MYCMSVTLEVSKPSGWLNANADCRESRGGHMVRGEVRPGWREDAGDRDAGSVQGRLDCRLGTEQAVERTRNMPNMSVTLEVLKLSGWLNAHAPCREPKGGIRCGAGCGPTDGGRRRPACSGGSTADMGHNRRGAHPEHVLHVRDARGIEAQRLVER